MLKVIQRFSKCCRANRCWLGVFWKPYIGQAVGSLVGCDESDRRGGRADCYPTDDEHVVAENR
jgi:hypothetical protein